MNETDGPSHRIHWTDREKEQLVTQINELLLVRPELSVLDALREVQEKVLPEQRRRNILTLVAVPWLEPALSKAKKAPYVEPVIVDKVILVEQKVSELPLESLLAEIFRRVVDVSQLKAQIALAIAQDIRNELPNAIRQISESKLPQVVRERKYKLLVVGLLGAQAHEIEKSYQDLFDLVFHKEEPEQILTTRIKNADAVFLMRNFCSHKQQEAIQKSRTRLYIVSGAISELKAVLDAFYYDINKVKT